MQSGSQDEQRQRTLRDTLDEIMSNTNLTRKDRAARKKSFALFERIFDRPLSSIPESFEEFNAAVAVIDCGEVGITKRTLRTAKSHINTSLKMCGVFYSSTRNVAVITPVWHVLLQTVAPKIRSRIYPIAAIMTSVGVEPSDLRACHVQTVWEKVSDFYPRAEPHEKARVAVAVWNSLTDLPHWPQVKLEAVSLLDRYTYPVTQFGGSFRAGVEEIRRDALSPRDGLLDPSRPKLASTAKDWCDAVYEVASAYCKYNNIAPSSLSSPHEILSWQVLDDAVEFWRDHLSVRRSATLERRAVTFRALTRRHASPSKDDLKRFETIIKNVTPVRELGVPKAETVELILRLKDATFRAKFFGAPQRVIERELAKGLATSRGASTALKACAWAILLSAPLDLIELVNMVCTEKLPANGEGVKIVVLHSPTRRDVMPVPAATIRLIVACQKRFGRLMTNAGPYCFPGRQGPKRPANLSAQISSLMSTELQAKVTACQVRFLVAGVYLLQHPQDYETVRRYLRWKSTDSVKEFFGFVAADAAQAAVSEAIGKRAVEKELSDRA